MAQGAQHAKGMRYVLLLLFTTLLSLLSSGSSRSGSSSATSRYDRSINIFSPEGDLLQVAYADIAGSKGESLVCIVTNDSCAVLCTPSPINEALLDRRSTDKVCKVDENIYAAFAGLAGDGRSLVRVARKICTNYRLKFGCSPSVQYLSKAIGEVQHEATLTGGERPYGVHMLLFGFDQNAQAASPSVFLSKASGHVSQWKAVAIGKNADKALLHMEKKFASSSPVGGDSDAAVAVGLSKTAAVALGLDILNEADVCDDRGEEEEEEEEEEKEEEAAAVDGLGMNEVEKASEAKAEKKSTSALDASSKSNNIEQTKNRRSCDVYVLRRDANGNVVLNSSLNIKDESSV